MSIKNFVYVYWFSNKWWNRNMILESKRWIMQLKVRWTALSTMPLFIILLCTSLIKKKYKQCSMCFEFLGMPKKVN